MTGWTVPVTWAVLKGDYSGVPVKPQGKSISRERRRVLGALGSAGAAMATPLALAAPDPVRRPGRDGADPQRVARDEAYWAEVADAYERTEAITNLEHGYWGRMARPVRERYLANLRRVDVEGAWYARRQYAEDHQRAVSAVAQSLGASPVEIAITRNATEAIHNLIRQHRHLHGECSVLFADIDYPPFKRLLHGLAERRGIRLVQITLPSRASGADVLVRYEQALERNPQARLMLATHASNQHGLVLPMARIADAARARGVDVVCDAAQSWGLVDYRIGDLKVDWAGFNLHKWIGAPLGLGVLYMRQGTLAAVAPYPGESDEQDTRVAARVHTGTSSFASVMTIPTALEFHHAVGGPNKEARLRYLRRLWTEPASRMPHIELLGGADEASWSGIGSLRLRGRRSADEARSLQGKLQEAGVFTVIRVGLDGGTCVRVTPQVFTHPDEIAVLVDRLRQLRA